MSVIALQCPHCGERALKQTIDSRPSGTEVRRRRICSQCGERATTLEFVAASDGRSLAKQPRDLRAAQILARRNASRGPWEGYPLELVTYP